MLHIILIATLVVLYGLVFPVAKICLLYAPPYFITAFRMILAGVILLAYLYFYQRDKIVWKIDMVWPMIVTAFTGIYLTNGLEFWGLQYMNSGKACFIYSFSPICTAILSMFIFSEKINRLKAFGLTLGILGFAPLLIINGSVEDTSGKIYFISMAEIALFLAALATSIGWTTVRISVRPLKLSPIYVNAITMLLGGIFALIHSLLKEKWSPLPFTNNINFYYSIIVLTIISNLIAYNLHAFLLKKYTATLISFCCLTTPLFATLFGWLLLKEVLPWSFWLSMVTVSAGLMIYYRQDLLHGYIEVEKNIDPAIKTINPYSDKIEKL